jgi:hypothetical protein
VEVVSDQSDANPVGDNEPEIGKGTHQVTCTFTYSLKHLRIAFHSVAEGDHDARVPQHSQDEGLVVIPLRKVTSITMDANRNIIITTQGNPPAIYSVDTTYVNGDLPMHQPSQVNQTSIEMFSGSRLCPKVVWALRHAVHLAKTR